MGSSDAGRPLAETDIPARLRQGVAALRPRRAPAPLPARYRSVLPASIVARWRELTPYDQRHLLAVAEDLAATGQRETVVLAGLLHDIGKAGRVNVVDRVAHVLLGRLAPRLRERLAERERPLPGLNGLHLLVRHAQAGAETLALAGMVAEVVWLVRHHESDLAQPDLAALRDADHRH